MKPKFQTQYFKNILVTLVLYRKQLHLSSLSQTPALGICSALGLYRKFLEGIHNSPNDVLLLSPKVNHILQNSTQWAAILQCIIIIGLPHPRINCVFTFQLQQQQQKTKPTFLHPSKHLSRLFLIFKQYFILILWINPIYTIHSLEHLGFPSFLALLWVLRFGFSFVLVFEYMTLLPNIIISCIYIIIKVSFLCDYCKCLEKSKKPSYSSLFLAV